MNWRATLDALPGLAFTLGPDGRIEFVNDVFRTYAGFASNTPLDDAWIALTHPSDVLPWIDAFESACATGKAYTLTHRLRRRDGGFHTFSAVTAPHLDPAGRIIRWFGVAIDIEPHANALASLQESDLRLRTFLDTLPQIVWTADATGWIEWYNPRWFEFTGQTPEEAAGWGWQAAHHPEDFPKVMERWPHSIATGDPFEMEFRLRRHDGEFRWMLTRVVPLCDEAGNVVRWYGSNTEIEEQRRRVERSARIARTMQEAFLPDRLPEGGGVRFDALYLPAESDALVGGDWYDALRLPDGRILLSCGDVAGHGLDAAMRAGRFRQTITVTALEDPDPSAILRRVNRIAMLQDDGLATAVVAVFDPQALVLTYALAGHPPPIVARRNEPSAIEAYGGVPLGIALDAMWTTVRIALADDAVVVFYTDGVTEFAHDIAGAERALASAAASVARDTAERRPAERILNAVMSGKAPVDDVAILVLTCGAARCDAPGDADLPLLKKFRFHSSDSRTAQTARHALMSYLGAIAGDEAEMYAAELVVGEAIANTVEHAPGLVEIFIDWTDHAPLFIIRDSGPGFTSHGAALPPDPMSEDGRGMFLIDALASEVELRRSSGYGMELRCRLPLLRGAAASR